ncbi:hypothetical protein KGQ25_03210 [Patescibacteria group bacterium]|nr:hypothetical protein [Patescibacteria group bacterium]
MWTEYVEEKQTLEQLARRYNHSHIWVRKQLETIATSTPILTPQPTVVIADTTFWGRRYGICVFRAWPLAKNIWWHEVSSELMAHYRYGRAILEEKGWTILAAVVDGRRGFLKVFEDIPVQICQFHQIKQVTKYLTRRPKTEAGRELRTLVLTLTKTDETTFIEALAAWYAVWGDFINQKTEYAFINGKTKWHYTHKNVRSAYRSLERNLPYLFTFQKYPELNIPNTTNSLDGAFSALKKKLGVHHGLRRDRRYKVISKLLRDGA